MTKSKLKIRLIALITAINIALGVILGSLLYLFWPASYFKWYPIIPLFYWIMGMAMAYFLDRVQKKHGDMIVTICMTVRLCKFVIALVFLWLYAALVGDHVKSFGFTLMLFYFIYLTLETYTFYLYEKRRIKHKDE